MLAPDFERTCGCSLALRESAGGDGRLIVRGANPNQTLAYFEGVEIPSVINGEFFDCIDFFLGGFGSRYGCAVGGVVEVWSRKGAAYAWQGRFARRRDSSAVAGWRR
jgi:outer membrane cobalamin receptor